MLADLGADVVYLGISRNKRLSSSISATPDDVILAQELASRADIVIENFKPGGLAKFGLAVSGPMSLTGAHADALVGFGRRSAGHQRQTAE